MLNSRKRNLFTEAEAAAPAVPIQSEEAARVCFLERTKDSGHGEGIPYAHQPNNPKDPDQQVPPQKIMDLRGELKLILLQYIEES
ncbi:hypothetical protein NPIL_333291 [Nephila pilipes]|uniref:Uncharacterized protein n=1 Tax=Nephila pilipes TaxID=299642 RepID=A0A8X6TKA8_NEPPI|nr:hypothetical protein NPIL_333291 [Nephila pilipes]